MDCKWCVCLFRVRHVCVYKKYGGVVVVVVCYIFIQ